MDFVSLFPWQYVLIIIGFLFLFSGLVCFEFTRKENLSLLLVIAGALLLRLFTSTLDAYINLWDEQYHAVVAKNMMLHPFKPTLIEKNWLSFGSETWTATHIWLHKQPLFLWQMALSMKLFGVNVFAVRLPSLIMMLIAAFFIFRIGKLLVGIREGLWAAVLFSTLHYGHSLSAGYEHTDHNDVAFLFYITAGIWAFTEYVCSSDKKMKWAILTGLFAGMAVLNKWLTGLLVFSAWFFYLVSDTELRRNLALWKHFFLSAGIAVSVFLPWQIYIHFAFPVESLHEQTYNSRHLFEAIEGHGGDEWYHLEQLVSLYGLIIPYLIVPAFMLFYLRSKNKSVAASLIFAVVFLYVFFAVAATKMPAFTFPLAALVSLALAVLASAALDFFFDKTGKLLLIKIILLLVFFLCCYLAFDMPEKERRHGLNGRIYEKNFFAAKRTKSAKYYASLPDKLNDKEYVIFNFPQHENVMAMFYLPFTCFDFMPDENTINHLQQKGLTIAVYKTGDLPPYIENNPALLKLAPPEYEVVSRQLFFIKAPNNKYLCEDIKEGKLIANRDTAGGWESFTLIGFRDSSFALQANSGGFISVRLNEKYIVNTGSSKMEDWEHITIRRMENNKVAFISCSNTFLSLQSNQLLVADKKKLDGSCIFELVKL